MEKILLVEDDAAIVGSLSLLLKQHGFSVSSAGGQQAALALLGRERFDLMLLDVSLPDGSGFAVCAAARAKSPELPVIFLTACDDEMSVVAGLDMGAEDYVTKPFRPLELLSRIRTALRRRGKAPALYQLGPVTVDAGRGTVQKNGEEIALSALEYKLLLLFLSNKGLVLSRDALLSALWDAGGDYVTDNTLTVYIKRLREKLEDDPQEPRLIKTIRGLGYKAEDGACG